MSEPKPSANHCEGCARYAHHHCYHCGKRAGLSHPAWCPNFDAAAESQGDPSDDYEAGYAEGFHHGVSSPRGSAEDDREQVEPSDAQVDAMQEILYDDYREGDRDVIRRAWRAALRAAGGVR